MIIQMALRLLKSEETMPLNKWELKTASNKKARNVGTNKYIIVNTR